MAQDIFGASPDIDLRKRWALMQLQQGTDSSPVHHPLQALARALQGTVGGYMAGRLEDEDKAAGAALFGGGSGSLPGLGSPQAPQTESTAMPASPGGMSAPMPQPGAPIPGNVPRGIRNNNPGNIEDGPFARKIPGYAGSDGRFARFDSPQGGQTAIDSLLASYGSRGINTVGGVINRWAPPSDNNPTSAYAATVAKGMGIDPNARIDLSDPATRQKIGMLIGQFENGKPVQMAQAGGGMPQMPGAPPAMPPPLPGAPPQQMAQNGVPGAMPPRALNAPVPNRSSVQIPPDVQATIQRLGADRRTQPQAMQLYMQYAKPVESIQPMTPEQRKQWNVPEGVSAGLDTVSGKPTFSQPANSVNVNTAANPVLEGVGKQIVKQRETAGTAVNSTIPFVHETRRALDEGAITGAFADQRLFASKVGALFGLEGDKAANTEVLRSTVGNQVLAHIKELGANPSNADRDYIEKVQGGQIALEEKSMRRLLDITEKYARQTVKNFNRDSQKLMSAPGGDQAYKSIAPLMSFEEPPVYQPPTKQPPAATPPADLKKKYGLD